MAGTKRTSDRVALGGIVAALCIVIMFLTGVVPALYIVSPMAAGLLMVILAEEVSVGWAWLTYLAVSLLSLMVTFDKEAALMFILFFGYYPMLRLNLEKIKAKPQPATHNNIGHRVAAIRILFYNNKKILC